MKRTNTVIIGGGQAGLAMSRSLTDRGVDHVVLERGQVGERWRSERWDSLRLLTPNWQTRLPGWTYRGSDPDGFMTRAEVIAYLEAYAGSFPAPVENGVTVTSVTREDDEYRVETTRGSWSAANAVIATGHCDRPHVPGFAAQLPSAIRQLTPTAYRNPSGLPEGGVLVVGASATGIQLAEEIHASGRAVTLAVGKHTRLPRRYRGRDIQWWLERVGIWDESERDVRSIDDARHEPSLQLIGSPEHRSLDLGMLQGQGVRLVGRAGGVEGDRIGFRDDLAQAMVAADARLRRLLRRIDDFVDANGMAGEVSPPDPIRWLSPPPAPSTLDLGREGIRTVLWATGFRRAYPWLRVPVLDDRGEIRHREGVTPYAGLYVLGLQFLRTRKSSFIDGVGADAAYLADRITARTRALSPVAA